MIFHRVSYDRSRFCICGFDCSSFSTSPSMDASICQKTPLLHATKASHPRCSVTSCYVLVALDPPLYLSITRGCGGQKRANARAIFFSAYSSVVQGCMAMFLPLIVSCIHLYPYQFVFHLYISLKLFFFLKSFSAIKLPKRVTQLLWLRSRSPISYGLYCSALCLEANLCTT